MSERLRGKVAIVTGGTAGIGEATARRLSEEGCHVVIGGRAAQRGNALASELGAIFVPDDLTADGAPERLANAALDSHGRLDILVNNAGVDHTGPLLTTPIGEVRELFDLNVFAAVLMLQAAGRIMAEAGAGSIVNVSSRLASIGVPTMGLYSASKGALLALTRAAAVELAPAGVRVNAVAPGMTRTPFYEAWIGEQEDPAATERGVISAVPQGRIATPQDVAAAIAYLASDDAAHVTGASLPVDGGYTAT
jgi:NAD(P)-dependent dehydrogenase (short-subunit alcohol dehydrogenase family)